MPTTLGPSPKPLTFRPQGLSDALDATNVFRGAMQQLVNLVPDSRANQSWVCRPASVSLTSFSGFTTPGFISGLCVVGNIAYGTIAWGLNSGSDQPFAYDLATASFLTVDGITSANVPTSPPTTGDWTPPIIAQVGSRVVVTHPGFPGGATKFGWFDVSGFSEAITGNTTSASPTITGNPDVTGIQPGMTITDGVVNIPANTTVVSTALVAITATGTTHSNTTIDSISPNTTGMAEGQPISGTGIPPNTTIASVTSSTAITISQSATASAADVSIAVSGATITMSANATGTQNNDAITVAGGTATTPLWGAGDTDRNNLPSVPVGVAQFNGRAYYALGIDGIGYSDSGFATRVSNTTAVQALLPSNGLPVTAIGPLGLQTILGGIVQAIIAFQGVSQIQQITGDQDSTSSPLEMNALPLASGTLAPLSLCPFELGLGFVSPEGFRWVNFSGQITPPLGDHGDGVTTPFIFAEHPSRICAAANADTIRISVINGAVPNVPSQEYCWDISRKAWHGPHTFPASLIQPWGDTFVISPVGVTAELFQSDIAPNLSSTFTENGTALSWTYQPTLLPDNGSVAMNAMIETLIMVQIPAGESITAFAIDDQAQVIGSATINAPGSTTLWGHFTWGGAVWGGTSIGPSQQRFYWGQPLVFKQLAPQISGASAYNLRISNLDMQYQELSYPSLAA